MFFSLDKYFDLLSKQGEQLAESYRTEFIPDYLYKYVSLLEENGEEAALSNEKKFKTLYSNEIWFSFPSELNDPYELRGFYLNREGLQENYGMTNEVIEMFCSRLLRIPVASFTANMASNLPMWAHYSNIHRGYCVQYKVKNKQGIKQVIYSDTKPDLSTALVYFIGNCYQYDETHDPEVLDRIQFLSSALQTIIYHKHSSWKYEQEFRIAYPDEYDKAITKGVNIPCNKIGISPAAVYTGINCNEMHKKRIAVIAQETGLQLFTCAMNEREFTVFSR